MYAKIGGNVPASETATFTVMKGGVAQTLTCPVAAAASTCNDTTHSFGVVAGDLVDVRVNCAGGTSALTASVSATMVVQ